jgi:D-amino-acid dehydrogenase
MGQRVVVIGGGIVGLSSAWYLAERGHEVVVLDDTDGSDNCSHGNMGYVAPSHIVTLSAPGMVAKGLRWMLNPESPFYIKPRLDLDLLRWGWLFYANATDAHVERSIPALRDLSLLSRDLYTQLHAGGLPFELWDRGLIMAYRTDKGRAGEEHVAGLASRAGLVVEQLDADQVRTKLPGVEVDVTGGVFYPQDAHVNPREVMAALRSALVARGVALRWRTAVTGLESSGKRVTGVRCGAEVVACDEVVLAAGSWSGRLGKAADLNLPIQPGKGYSFTLRNVPVQLAVPMILAETKVALTPFGDDLHIGGTMELSGFNNHTDPRRVRGLVRAVETYLPNIPVAAPSEVWNGLRPVSPDGLPYIGRSKRWDNLVVAAGHAMLGMSLGPATGHLVADTIDGQQPSFDTRPFNPDRFA